MRYLLDTNTCIAYLNGRSPAVRNRLEGLAPQDVALCAIVKAELLFGAQKSKVSQRTLAKLRTFFSPLASLPFDDPCAEAYARIRADLERAGTPIGPNDLLIASIARAHDVTLVTSNVSEFQRVEGLQLENWESERSGG
jgi:tRNA(fMet)-specific endonuclease VapC